MQRVVSYWLLVFGQGYWPLAVGFWLNWPRNWLNVARNRGPLRRNCCDSIKLVVLIRYASTIDEVSVY
jgi:hypothetical protein